MGLFQNLLETYEKCSAAVGIVQTDLAGNANEKKTLLPMCHTTFESQICIRINQNGEFISAFRDKKATTIIIPCTDDSEGRSGTACFPHPLCDKLEYLSVLEEKKLSCYLSQLDKWREIAKDTSKQILDAIYKYIIKNAILEDLYNSDLFLIDECVLSENGKLIFATKKNSSGKDEIIVKNLGVRFIVSVNGNNYDIWNDINLRESWINFVKRDSNKPGIILFDYLSGINVDIIGQKHPKKINRATSGAKLLSCNDKSEFTFRGRFAEQNDAIIVDYVQSQKMHQMLRWLIVNYGYPVDSQVIVTWAVDNNTEVKARAQDNSYDLFVEMEEIKTNADVLAGVNALLYDYYAKKLKGVLQGYGNASKLKQHSRKICIAVFDAATTGRMGVVFYQELSENSYLENIVNWHNDTSYYLTTCKKEKDENGKDKITSISYIGAPSYDDIIFAIYGKSRGDKSYNILKKKVLKQLLECMFGSFAFPKSMLEMAVNRASHPMSFNDSNGKFNENDWKQSINITCALARKFYKQQKEEIQLELETIRNDRDYLFGRLLSVADKMENEVLYKSGNKRPTNAVKLMSAFQVKPYSTWGQLYSQLIPYRNQLDGARYYQSLIDEIMGLFRNGDFEKNYPLSPLYLLGYSAQNRVLYKKNKKTNLEVNGNDDIAEQN